jgi:AcrR family transcriptional regulator
MRSGKRNRGSTPAVRGPGRPAGEPAAAVRRALIDAARTLCIETGLDAATTKSIAERAGVNPAMINYYFGSKEGLGRAMMLESMQPVLEQLESAVGAAALSLGEFMRGYMRALASNPWLPQLVVREVLPANGRFRELFFDEIVAHAGPLLRGLVDRAGGSQAADTGVDPALLPVTIASMAVFPFLAAPVLERALDVNPFDAATTDRLIAHNLALLGRLFGTRTLQ